MFDLLLLVRLFHSRESLLIENLVLRQQLAVFKRKHRRPRLAAMDKLFWVALRRFWSSWKNALIVVTPDTVLPVAARRFSVVLAAPLPGTNAAVQESGQQGDPRVDLQDSSRES